MPGGQSFGSFRGPQAWQPNLVGAYKEGRRGDNDGACERWSKLDSFFRRLRLQEEAAAALWLADDNLQAWH